MVQSPLDSILVSRTAEHGPMTDSDSDGLLLSTPDKPPQTNSETSPHDKHLSRLKLHSLLDSYMEPSTTKPKECHKTPYQVKFKPRIPTFPKSTTTPKLAQSAPPLVHSPLLSSRFYRSTTANIGPHQWETCPRRSPKPQRSISAPNSPAKRTKHTENYRPLSADFDDDLLALSDLDEPQTETDTRPPFVVRHADPHLMGRWNFCGCSRAKNTNAAGSEIGPKRSILRKHEVLDDSESFPGYQLLNESLPMSSKDYVPTSHSGRISTPLTSIPSPTKNRSQLFTTPRAGDFSSYDELPSYCSPGKKELMAKYLYGGRSSVGKGVCRPGNVRPGVDNPGRAIEERIERLKAECCNCRVCAIVSL